MKKKSQINRSSIPFFVLILIHSCLFLLLMKQRRKRYTWILLLSNIGFAYLFEYIVLNLFQAYRYKPAVIKQRYLDNLFGAILSQALFVPVTATFVTVFQKNWKWKIGFAFYYYFIEKLFLRLNIYKVNWWKPIYTLILINVYFFISNGFYKALINRKNWALKTAHYLSIGVIGITFMYITAVRRKIRFGRGYFHSWREHFKIAPLYSLVLTAIAVLTSSKSGLHYRLLSIFCNIVIDLFLIWKGILKIKSNYFLENIPFSSFMVLLSRFFYKLIYKQS